jgi:hypothetical protein
VEEIHQTFVVKKIRQISLGINQLCPNRCFTLLNFLIGGFS